MDLFNIPIVLKEKMFKYSKHLLFITLATFIILLAAHFQGLVSAGRPIFSFPQVFNLDYPDLHHQFHSYHSAVANSTLGVCTSKLPSFLLLSVNQITLTPNIHSSKRFSHSLSRHPMACSRALRCCQPHRSQHHCADRAASRRVPNPHS